MLQMITMLNKCYSFELSAYQRIPEKNVMVSTKKKTAHFNIDKNIFLNQHVRKISEGSCNNEDWIIGIFSFAI